VALLFDTRGWSDRPVRLATPSGLCARRSPIRSAASAVVVAAVLRAVALGLRTPQND
jgi:hypothetical protein